LMIRMLRGPGTIAFSEAFIVGPRLVWWLNSSSANWEAKRRGG
jgi:hypothetical protein